MFPVQITSSIVLYNPGNEVYESINSFLNITSLSTFLYIIDNSRTNIFQQENKELLAAKNVEYIFVGKNIGYGAGHNIAMQKSLNLSEYHLVLNPDIYFERGVVERLYSYMNEKTDVGQLMPMIRYPDGNIQYLCKLIPTPLNLIARLLPYNIFRKQNENFELRFTGYEKIMNIPYLSGCFMLFRCSALKKVGLFDERFFMYPEDIDITRRMHVFFKTIFFPHVQVYHKHEKSSFKNFNMLIVHITNMVKYFNKWGWFFDAERKKINKQIVESLKA